MRVRRSTDRLAKAWAFAGAILLLLTGASGALTAQARTTAQRQQTPPAPVATFPVTSFAGLRYVSVGPQGPGGALAVTGSRQRPLEYFAGTAGGGLWKTTDAGATWQVVTDGQIRGSTVAAVAVAPSHADTLYLGTGEWDAEHGNSGYGVYRSVDAGKTWTHVGLEGTRAISRIVVHPTDAATVYAAAIGSPHSAHRERGVFRSFDAGKTWQLVLSLGDSLGAYDIALSPRNPQLVFASFWNPAPKADQRGKSRLFRSDDGGDSWNEITGHLASTASTRGRIAVSVSPADSLLVFIALETERVQFLVSRDGGTSFVSAGRNQLARGSTLRIAADPASATRVYVINGSVWRSDNTGASFRRSFESGRDVQDLWLAPENARRAVVAAANGAIFTQNGGAALSLRPLPALRLTGVVYTASAPMLPCVGILKGGAVCVRLNALGDSGIVADRIGGTLAFSADDSLVLYGIAAGELKRLVVAGRIETPRSVGAAPRSEPWHAPSPLVAAANGALYTASNRVWRSDDGGSKWKAVSAVLTRSVPGEYIATLAASPFDSATIWAATSDGLVYLTRDGGASWKSVGPTNPASGTAFTSLQVSPHDAATLYASARRTNSDDPAPYAWKTLDYGSTWVRIDDGIPDDDAIRTIVEDGMRRGLLWAGTDRGVFVSFNQGGKWQGLTLGMPEVAITGIATAERAIMLATDGRGLWMLDDATPIRSLTQDVAKAAVHLFDPPDMAPGSPLTVRYHLGRPADSVVVEIRDSDGELVRHFATYRKDSALVAPVGSPTRELGLNSVTWDGRFVAPATSDSALPPPGRAAPPGSYKIRIAANGSVDSATITITDTATVPGNTNRSLRHTSRLDRHSAPRRAEQAIESEYFRGERPLVRDSR